LTESFNEIKQKNALASNEVERNEKRERECKSSKWVQYEELTSQHYLRVRSTGERKRIEHGDNGIEQKGRKLEWWTKAKENSHYDDRPRNKRGYKNRIEQS
jgi:hypothetical protein